MTLEPYVGVSYDDEEEVRRFTVAYICLLSDKYCRREYLFSNHVEYLLGIS